MEIYVIREDKYYYGDISHSSIVGAYKIEKDAIKHLSDGIDTNFYPVMRTMSTKDGHTAVVHSTVILGGSCATVPAYSVARYIVPVNLT